MYNSHCIARAHVNKKSSGTTFTFSCTRTIGYFTVTVHRTNPTTTPTSTPTTTIATSTVKRTTAFKFMRGGIWFVRISFILFFSVVDWNWYATVARFANGTGCWLMSWKRLGLRFAKTLFAACTIKFIAGTFHWIALCFTVCLCFGTVFFFQENVIGGGHCYSRGKSKCVGLDVGVAVVTSVGFCCRRGGVGRMFAPERSVGETQIKQEGFQMDWIGGVN